MKIRPIVDAVFDNLPVSYRYKVYIAPSNDSIIQRIMSYVDPVLVFFFIQDMIIAYGNDFSIFGIATEREIILNRSELWTPDQVVKVLLHEIGHKVCGSRDTYKGEEKAAWRFAYRWTSKFKKRGVYNRILNGTLV